MTSRTKSAVVAMLVALALFAAATLWGVAFAFPEPDASPEKAARMQFHAQASSWLMLAAVVLFIGALARLVWPRPR